jgi:hypothetical protein
MSHCETPAERGVTTIQTTPQQALSGTEIGVGPMVQCSVCARSIGEASRVALRAHRLSDEAQWTVAHVLCEGCITSHGTIETATAGARELVLAGRLVLRGDAGVQDHCLCFQADEGRDALLDYSAPTDGTV